MNTLIITLLGTLAGTAMALAVRRQKAAVRVRTTRR
ncbi:MAG: hypothetical protein DELT_02508 [Desulfovibrio sp.]